MIPNPIFEIDPTTQQTPGVTVTPEEQNLANSGVLKYTFQIELNVKNATEILAFPRFTNRVIEEDQHLQFLPWFNNEKDNLPEIDQQHSPYQTVWGEVRLKHYLGS